MCSRVPLFVIACATVAAADPSLRGALNGTALQDMSNDTQMEQKYERLVGKSTEEMSAWAPRSCCSRCPAFCSQQSGHCYASQAKPYYEQCNGPAPLHVVAPPVGGRTMTLHHTTSLEAATMTLYHTTSLEAAKSIIAGNFRPGHGGWCGPAIYFMSSPGLPKAKRNPRTTKTGAIVQAEVRMGKICSIKRTDWGCSDGWTGRCCKTDGGYGTKGAASMGCNSIRFNPGDGDEYIIWNSAQVVSTKILCTPCRNGGLHDP